MNRPPTSMVVEITERDVQGNLAAIVDSMERIRQEAIADLGANDEQKIDYLRLTGELAGCLKAFAEENDLMEHVDSVHDMISADPLLRRYDPSQAGFWESREPEFSPVLADACAVLLRGDFTAIGQTYHVFQALKYMGIEADERDEVYETILPMNSLLSAGALDSSEVGAFLARKLLCDAASDGAGVRSEFSIENHVRGLEQIGALYVDVSHDSYQQMKELFSKTILVEEGKKRYTRVIFGNEMPEERAATLGQFQELAQLDLGEEAEQSLENRMSNFYSFGKDFLAAVNERIDPQEPAGSRNLASRASIVLDESPEDNGNKKTQEKWIRYWQDVKDGRVMASMGDLYIAFKDLRSMHESGTEQEKAKTQTMLASLREDFDWQRNKSWLISGTRIFYSAVSESSRIVQHHGCNRSELVKERTLDIPVYLGELIEKVVDDPKGLHYLQTLFDTEDDGEEIMQNMEFISGKDRSEIKVWTPPLSTDTVYVTRARRQTRAAGLSYVGNFRVNGYYDIYLQGRSRGVLISPR